MGLRKTSLKPRQRGAAGPLTLQWLRTFGWRGRGVAQGAPISPLRANLYLHPVDRLMAMQGYRMVRYAYDFIVQTGDEKSAHRALADVERWLRGRGLALNKDKTKIVPPKDGFVFLGETIKPIARNVQIDGAMPLLLVSKQSD